MKKLTALLLACLFALPAFAADRTFTDQSGNTGVLHEDACRLVFPNKLAAEQGVTLKRATLTMQGQAAVEMCYAEGNGLVMLVDDLGDTIGPVPAELFK